MAPKEREIQKHFIASRLTICFVWCVFISLSVIIIASTSTYEIKPTQMLPTVNHIQDMIQELTISRKQSIPAVTSNADVKSTHGSGTLRNCLYTNMCISDTKTNVYNYIRNEDFEKNIESKINYSCVVLHVNEVVPRQMHFIRFSPSGKDIQFEILIAMMAAQRYAKPSRILFWHNNLPSGKYWDEALKRVNNLYFVYLKPPTSIRGRKVAVVQHQADVARLEILLEYGGIYLDTDSILVNPVDDLLKYDITMGREVPDGLGNGILFSKPWSDFMKMWHHNYSTFVDSQWGTHSVLLPHKLHWAHPNLLHLAEKDFFRPNWKETQFLYTPGKHWKWKTNNYAVHFYNSPKPLPNINPEFIKKWNCTVGAIMRYIYFGKSELQTS